MKTLSAITTAVVIANLLDLAAPGDALAYIDPSTGSMLFQAIIGAVAAAIVALRLFWSNIKHSFKRDHSRKNPSRESIRPEDGR